MTSRVPLDVIERPRGLAGSDLSARLIEERALARELLRAAIGFGVGRRFDRGWSR
jgi:hypothetical protein